MRPSVELALFLLHLVQIITTVIWTLLTANWTILYINWTPSMRSKILQTWAHKLVSSIDYIVIQSPNHNHDLTGHVPCIQACAFCSKDYDACFSLRLYRWRQVFLDIVIFMFFQNSCLQNICVLNFHHFRAHFSNTDARRYFHVFL
jgi:hypothetical protein